jgi:hypothetical protein
LDIDDETPRGGVGRRLLRVLLVGGAVLVALAVGGVWWLGSPPARDLVRRVAIEELTRLTGEDVFIERVRLLERFPPRLEISGLAVHSADPARAGLPLLRVDRLDVRLGADVDVGARIVPIDFVSVQRLQARVALDGGQPRDYAHLVELLRPGPDDGKPSPRPVQFDVRRVEVDDAGARVSVDPLGLGTSVAGIWLEFDQSLALAPDAGRATARRTAPGSLRIADIEVVIGEIRERATLERGSFDVEDGLLTFTDYGLGLRTGRVDLSGQLPLGPPRPSGPGYRLDAQAEIELSVVHDAWPKLPELKGAANLRVGVQGKGRHPEIDYDLTATDVEALVHGPKKDLLFKLGDLSLRGYYLEDLLKVTRSSVQWAGGRIGVEAGFTLREDLPFEATLDIGGLDLARVLDGVTVPGSWVQMLMTGSVTLAGRIKDPVRGLWGKGSAQVNARDLIVRDGAWDAPVAHKEMLHVPRADITAGVTLDREGVHLVGGRILGPNGSDLAIDTDFIFARPMGLRLHAAGQSFDTRDLRDTIVGLNVQGHGGIEVDIVGPTNDLDIAGRLELGDFVFLNWAFGRVQGDVHWHARKDLEFTRLRSQRGESAFESEVRVLFADTSRGGSRERLEIDLVTSVPEGHARAQDLLPIFFGDAIKLSGTGSGEAHLWGPPSALNGTGRVRVEDASYLWERFESVEMEVNLRAGDLFITEGWARKPSGASVFARGSIGRDGAVDVGFTLPDMAAVELEPVRAAGMPLGGRVSGVAVLSGDLKNVWVDGRLRLTDASWAGEPLGDSDVRLAVQDHVATASGTLLDGGLTARAELGLQGIWPYSFAIETEQRLSLDPWLPPRFTESKEPVTAGLVGSLQGTGTLRDGWHALVLEVPEFEARRGSHIVRATRAAPLVIALDGGALRFAEVTLDSPDGATNLRVDGWLRPGGPLDLGVSGRVDIAFLELAADIFDRAEARSLSIDELRLTGTTQSLDLDGAVTLKDALIKTIYFPHAIEIERARVSLRDRVVRIEELEGRLGGGRLERAAGSTIRLDRSGYRPRQYDLHVDCRECTVRYPSFMPPARGDAQMWFRGTSPDKLTLGGEVVIEEMVLRDTMNWQRSVLTFREKATQNLAEEASTSLFGFDVSIDSIPGSVRIANNLGDMRGTARDLHIGGSTNRVLITGIVELSGGTFRYKGHEFQLEPGTAEFREGTEWFPWLEVTMFTDLATRDEDYRVTLNASGRLDNPTLTSTAQPFLTAADINSLLLFGLTQEELERAELADLGRAALAAAAGTYGESAAASLGQSVGEQNRSALPDRFEVVPVYTDTTGSTTFWAVLTKEVVPDLLTLEAGVGVGGASIAGVAKLKLQVLRNFYLEGSWITDDTSSQAYGNVGLDFKLELDAD